MSEEIVSASPEKKSTTRVSFEDWVDTCLKQRPDYIVLKTNVLYYGCMVNLSFSRAALLQLAKENNGMLKAETAEFDQAQKQWWYYYRKIMLLRSFLLRMFDVPAPNWKDDIIPEREYCNILLSQEDFTKFILQEGSGMSVQKAEGDKNYGEVLRENKMQERKNNAALREALMEEKEEDKDDEDEETKPSPLSAAYRSASNSD